MVQTWALGSRTGGKAAGNHVAAHGNRYSRVHTSRHKARANWKAARALFFVLALLIIFGGFTMMRTFAASEQVPTETAAELVVYADEGDTLWELAAALKKDSMDTRQAVHLLMKRNNLHNTGIQSGQKIIVPSSILP